MGRILTFKGAGNPAIPSIVNEYKEALPMAIGPASRTAQVKKDRWLRMQAIQIVAQLPDEPEDARRVLEMALGVLGDFVDRSPGLDLIKPD
jgi:hypothetical protein